MAPQPSKQLQKAKPKRTAVRRDVVCECSMCKGVRHVPQGERQRHLKRDHDARLRRIQQEALNSVSPMSVVSTPSSAPPDTTAMDVDSPAFPDEAVPGSTGMALQELGDPVEDFQMHGVSEPPLPHSPHAPLATPTTTPPDTPIQPPQEPGVFGVPDGWEDADPADEEDVRTVPPAMPEGSNGPRAPVPSTATSDTPSLAGHTHPVAWGVPLAKAQENTPDPFEIITPRASTRSTQVTETPTTGMDLLYVLATWLHAQFRLPFRACAALVKIVVLIVKFYGVVITNDPISTLPRIMSKIDVEPTIHLLPICPSCLEVYPAKASTPSVCVRCNSDMFKAKRSTGVLNKQDKRTPLLSFPFKSIQSSLEDILAVPGAEEELDKWRKVERRLGRYTDIFDGAVTRSLKCPDGSLFFRNIPGDEKGPDGVLRIGVNLGVDWFSYHRSQIAPSYTSCPMSFNIANFPPHLRYRTSNLILTGIMPGPKEQDPDECQRYIRIFVNELIRLWHGVTIPTPSCPEGRRVEVILICVCCDKPAAHKMGGFASHSHRFFCTRCWIQQKQKAEPASFKKGGFAERTDMQHRFLGERYADKTSQSARDAYVQEFATRWSELARLPYFDMVRCIVIDPMHNLLLGLVKNHFYHIWVQEKILRPTKELRFLHQILKEFIMPSYLGRLPTMVGIPAGGSLTADQWMLMATVIGPIAVPRVWDKFMADPETAREQRAARIQAKLDKKRKAEDAKKAKAEAAKLARAAQAEAAKQAKAGQAQQKKSSSRSSRTSSAPAAGTSTTTPADLPAPTQGPPIQKKTRSATEKVADEDEEATPCLHPDDPANFLKLSNALRLLLSRVITDEEIDEAFDLLSNYCSELVTLYGPEVIKPNHHYAMHTPECVRDFGPLHGFWTFLFERLNKVLKGYSTNNHSGGEVEATFFREFHRSVLTSRLISRTAAADKTGFFSGAADIMFQASADDRGTVQALAKEVDSHYSEVGLSHTLSPRFEKKLLPSAFYVELLQYLSLYLPDLKLHSSINPNPPFDSIPLNRLAYFFDYAIIGGRRFNASGRGSPDSRGNSMVQVKTSERGDTWVGELLDVVHIDQDPGLRLTLGHFRWMMPLHPDLSGTVWAPFEPLGVKLWRLNQFVSASEPQPSTLLPLSDIICHVALHNVTIQGIGCTATLPVKLH